MKNLSQLSKVKMEKIVLNPTRHINPINGQEMVHPHEIPREDHSADSFDQKYSKVLNGLIGFNKREGAFARRINRRSPL